MQRYDARVDQDMIPYHEETADGDWVKYDAARAETERLTASNAALIRERSSMIHTHRDNINRLRADLDGWKQAARQAEAERDASAKWLGELLAVIHRDGGHYQSRHGDEKAVAEAHRIVARFITDLDDARAQVAAAFKLAENEVDQVVAIWEAVIAIRALTPADAQAALEAYGREKMREGMRMAANLFKDANHGEHIMDAILAEMETLK